jgi:hypothetical protein
MLLFSWVWEGGERRVLSEQLAVRKRHRTFWVKPDDLRASGFRLIRSNNHRVFSAVGAAVIEGLLFWLILADGSDAGLMNKPIGNSDRGVISFAIGKLGSRDDLHTMETAPNNPATLPTSPRLAGEKQKHIKPETMDVPNIVAEQVGAGGENRIAADDLGMGPSSSVNGTGSAHEASAAAAGVLFGGGDAFNPYATAAALYLPSTQGERMCAPVTTDGVLDSKSNDVTKASAGRASINDQNATVTLSADDIATLRQRIVSLEPDICGALDIIARVDAQGSIFGARVSKISLRQAPAETRSQLGIADAATSGSTTNVAHTADLDHAARVAQGIIGIHLSIMGDSVRWFHIQIIY